MILAWSSVVVKNENKKKLNHNYDESLRGNNFNPGLIRYVAC